MFLILNYILKLCLWSVYASKLHLLIQYLSPGMITNVLVIVHIIIYCSRFFLVGY